MPPISVAKDADGAGHRQSGAAATRASPVRMLLLLLARSEVCIATV
jgi:hypothetical protein